MLDVRVTLLEIYVLNVILVNLVLMNYVYIFRRYGGF